MERRSHSFVNILFGSTKKKLALLLLIVSLVPIAVVTYWGFIHARRHFKHYRIEVLESIATLKIKKIESFFKQLEDDIILTQNVPHLIKNLSTVAKFADDSIDSAYTEAKGMLDSELRPFINIRGYIDIMIVDPKGNLVYSARNSDTKKLLDNLFYDPEGKAFEEGKKGFYFSGVSISKREGYSFEGLVTAPVYGLDGNYVGVVALVVDMMPLFKFIQDSSGLGKTGETLVGTRYGSKIVFLNPLRHDLGLMSQGTEEDWFHISAESKHALPMILGSGGEEGVLETTDYRQVKVLAVYRYIPVCNWGFVSKIDIEEEMESTFALKRQLAFITSIVVVVVLLIAFFIAGIITRRLRTLVNASKKITEGNLDIKVDVGMSRDELGVLAFAFNTMVSRIKESYNDLEKKIAERTRSLEEANNTLDLQGKMESDYNNIVTLLNSSMNTEELLPAILDLAVSITGSQSGVIYLYDENLKYLRVGACYAVDDKTIRHEKIGLGIGLTGQAAEKKKPIIVSDIPDGTVFKIKPGLGDIVPKNIGNFPVIFQDKLLGVIVLASLKQYSDERLVLINKVTAQIAVSLNNISAYELAHEQAKLLLVQETELKKREKRIRTVLDNTVDGIITIDEHGIIETFNYSAEKIFGYRASEVVGNNIKMLQPEPYHSEHDNYLKNYLNTGKKKVIGVGREVVGLRKDGKTFPLNLSVSEVVVNEKRIFTGIIRDITEQKNAAVQLQERARLLALGSDVGRFITQSDDIDVMLNNCTGTVVEHLDASFARIWILNEEDQILELKASAGMYTHIDGGHACVPVGKYKIGLIAEEREPHLTNDVLNDPRVSNKDWARQEGMVAFAGYPLMVEKRLIGVIAMFSRSKIPNAVLKALGSVSTQIALGINRKQSEKDLIVARDEAEAATHAKSNFLASMSHEIRTPMNAIVGMAELLGETQLTDEQRNYINIFRNAGDNLLGVINDILDFSKIESGNMELEQTSFDPCKVLDDVSDMMAFRVKEKGLELVISLAPDIPNGIVGDPVRLYQVLTNLVSNAVKFTANGEIVVSVECEHTIDSKGPEDKKEVILAFSVRDTGIGIRKEKLDTIFQSFSQADSSTTRKYGGTGLGLSISQRIVGLMGSKINVESEEGRGSLFSFTARFGIDAKYQREHKAQEIDLTGIRVLVVDDNSTNRMVLRKTLANWGAETTESRSGNDCLAELKRAHASGNMYKLVLLDYQMPGMDGLEVTQRIKADPDLNATIILLTSSDVGKRASLIIKEHGLSAYMTKPIKRSQLRGAINSSLGIIKTEDAESNNKVEPLITSQSKRILLVEDNEDNRNLILAYLKKTTHETDTAENGKVAVDKYKSGDYDLVLMDIEMPVMDGYAATREIREWEKKNSMETTPVIALTAHAMKEHEQKSFEAGCNGYVTKPIKKTTLMETIKKFNKEA